MKKLNKKNLHRILAMVLVLSMLGANVTTLSFATEEQPQQPEQPTYSCGLQEHTHSEECFEKELVCDLPEAEGHEHVGTCYEYRQETICELEESEGHEHDESCYTETETVSNCEFEDHTHGPECYDTEENLTCQLHVHDETCTTEQPIYTCGLEPAEGHTHTEECWQQIAELICEEHLHGEACYQVSEEPICGLQEHTHSEACIEEDPAEQTIYDESGMISVFAGPEVLPEGTEIRVSSLFARQDLLVEESEQLAFAYDITLVAEGAEVQPNGTVQVTVPLQNALPEGADWVLEVYHITEEETLSREPVPSWVNPDQTISFLAESFSVYIGTIVKDSTIILTDGGGYRFYSDASCTILKTGSFPIDPEKTEEYVYLKAESGYSITSVTVENLDGTASTATVTGPEDGVYTVCVPTSVTQDQVIAVAAKLDDPASAEDVASLIDVNFALLEWKAKGATGSLSFELDDTAYVVTDSTSYDAAYQAVYEELLDKAVLWNGNSSATSITTDIIWKVEETAAIEKDLTIGNNGRVVILCNDSALLNVGLNAKINLSGGMLSVQGQTPEKRIAIDGGGSFTLDGFTATYKVERTQKKLILLSEGSLYLEYADIQNYVYKKESSSLNGGAIHIPENLTGITNVYASDMLASKCMSTGGSFMTDLYSKAGSELCFYNCDFTECVAYGGLVNAGGAVMRVGRGYGIYTFEQCDFYNNTSRGGGTESANAFNGGGVIRWDISAGDSATGIFNNCNFYENKAEGHGGAISGFGGVQLNNCKIYNNTATLSGGGVYIVPATQSSTNGTSDGYEEDKVGSITFGPGTEIYNNSVSDANGIGGGIHFRVAISKVSTFVRKAYDLYVYVNGASIHHNQANKGGGIAMSVDYAYKCGVYVYEGSAIYENNAEIGGAVYIESKDTAEIKATNDGFNIEGGAVYDNNATSLGGAVYIDNGLANVSGGEISDNKAVSGAGIYIENGEMTVSGGSVRGNTATENGAGAYLANGALSVTGGSFTGNSAVDGGGAYMGGGTLSVTGGSIASNNATNGAGAYMAGGTMNISGTSEITANIASANGGGAYLADGTLSITGGSIAGNNASNGAGVYMGGGEMTVSDTAGITGNTATVNGGGAYLADGTLSVTGGSIASNSAANGAGVYMGGGEMTVSGTAGITGNTATANGGGAYLADGTLNVTGGDIESNDAANGAGVYMGGGIMNVSDAAKIKDNTASVNGGGAYLSGGTMNVSGGSIESNQATGNGGGAFLSGGKLELSGGQITNNTAISGGGAYLKNGNVTMSGGTVSENRATAGDGGGMYVSAEGADVDVLIYSGTFIKNEAARAGGALAVCGDAYGEENINVTIGLHKEHVYTDVDGIQTLTPIRHDPYTHKSCPVISGNVSQQKGGAILVSGGPNTVLEIYCLDEDNNKVGDGKEQPSNFMMVEGGKVIVSTAESMGEGESAEDDHEHGAADIENSVYVIGGQVDLYGATSNPDFADAITVDIPKNDTTSHFEDHRHSDDYYTILYYENFKDPQTNNVSGQYKSYQIPKNDTHIIKGVIYSHPGYEIKGWYTDKNGSNPNTNHAPDGSAEGKYEVGHEYTFDGNPIGDLIIYAQWDATGYFVRFNSNVPHGETYSGTMVDLDIQYGVKKNLTPNAFKYPGYRFVEWKDENGTSYADGQEVENLANEKNAVVMLYAQWEVCDHADCTYTYTKLSDTRMKRECECGGQTIIVSISADSPIPYDGNEHPAELIRNNSAWVLKQSYTKGGTPFYGTPKDAGVYTYTVKDPNNSDMVISVTFEITKADQPNPPAPTYTVTDNTMTVPAVTDSPALSVYHDLEVKTQYRLVYYDGSDEAKKTDWKQATDNVVTFNLESSYTNYYVEARYSEGINHNVSGITRSAKHFHIGGAVILVKVQDGMTEPTLTESGTGGAIITVGAQSGYYLSADVSAAQEGGSGETGITRTSASREEATFLLSGIPSAGTITVTISGVGSELTVHSAVTETEVFTAVSDNRADITQESAFTAYYRITNYSTDVYSGLGLSFASPIPQGTTILLMDKSESKTTWWSYTATGSVSSVSMESFTRMGSNDPFVVKKGTLQYQFIVDFAEAASSPSAGGMDMSLQATKSDANAKELNAGVDVNLSQKQSYSAEAVPVGMSATVKLVVTSPANSTSTKWNGRNVALVLTPPSTIPADTLLQVEGRPRLVTVRRNADGNFVIPCEAVENNEVTFRMISDLLPAAETTYTFDAKWVASRSLSASTIAGGTLLAETTVTVTKEAETQASLKVTGTGRLFNVGDTMTVKVQYKMGPSCEISAQLQRLNENGGYSNTGLDLEVKNLGDLKVALGGQNPGDFRVLVEIREGQDVLAQVPYYFILQQGE